MPRRLIATSLILAGSGLLASSGALADGSETINPGTRQRAAITRAWAKPGTYRGPSKCLIIKISKNSPWLAGVAFNTRARGCTPVAFDGATVLYGAGTSWFVLESGSSVPSGQCTALKRLMGVNGWQDLAGFAGGLGCGNVD